MSQPLPPEIQVRTTPTGMRYLMPWRTVPPELRRGNRGVVAVAVLLWAVAACILFQAPRPPNAKGSGGPPFGILFLIAGGVALAFTVARRFGRCFAEAGPNGLVLYEWQGPLRQRRERAPGRIRAILVHPLPGATTAAAGTVTATDDGVIEVACDGIQAVWWGHGYPRALLEPLAAELAARCRVPHRPAGRPEEPLIAVPPFAEQAVLDADTVEVADQPPDSRIVASRSPDRVTLTLPPPFDLRSKNAPSPGLLAGLWLLVPVVGALAGAAQVLQHGLPAPGHWLLVAGMLAIGAAVVLFLEHGFGARTTFTVRGGRLTRLKTSSVLGPERLGWRREEVFALRTVTTKGGKGPPKAAVMLYPAAGAPVQLLESTALAEMGWIATLFRGELGVPAVPGLPATPAAEPGPPPAAPAPRPRQPLPPEVRVETTATGTRYRLPWLRPPVRLWRHAVVVLPLALAALGGGICLWTGAYLPDWLREASVPRGLGALVLLGFGGLLVIAVPGILVQRCSVDVGPGELRFRQRLGLFASERSWPVAHVRLLVTRRLPGGAVGEAEVPGLIEVVGESRAPFRFGLWYPVGLLRPLAQELAERLHVPEEAGDVLTRLPEVVPSIRAAAAAAEEDVPDEDLVDQGKPPGGRAVVERTGERVTVVLPPPGYRGDREARVLLPFAVAAAVFTGLNVLAALRLAVAGPWGSAEFLGVAAWLLGSAALAALLLLWVAHRAGCRTALQADQDGLAVVRSSRPLRPRRRAWPRDRIVALRFGTASRVRHGGKGFAVRLFLRDGGAVNVWTGDDEAELRWLATVLRQALAVPPVPA